MSTLTAREEAAKEYDLFPSTVEWAKGHDWFVSSFEFIDNTGQTRFGITVAEQDAAITNRLDLIRYAGY